LDPWWLPGVVPLAASAASSSGGELAAPAGGGGGGDSRDSLPGEEEWRARFAGWRCDGGGGGGGVCVTIVAGARAQAWGRGAVESL